MFEKVGQSPWCEGGVDFLIDHLNKWKECAHFKRNEIDNVDRNTHADLDGVSSVAPEQVS